MRGLEPHGFAVVRSVLDGSDIDRLATGLPAVEKGSAGMRSLHELPWMRTFATTSALAALAREALGNDARVVRILYFDKQLGSNWKLPFHQDLTIAVRERVELEGYGPWSVKDGIIHVQPPAELLERMIAVRLHLDDCPASNGALRVLPGTHLHGKLPADAVDERVSRGSEAIVEAARGDCVLMRPLLLHASSPAAEPRHRRVLHIEYGAATLPAGLHWFLGWPPTPNTPTLNALDPKDAPSSASRSRSR